VLLHYLGKEKVKNTGSILHLNAECCFANRHTKHIHIVTWSVVTAEPPSIRTRIGRMNQTKHLRREHSMSWLYGNVVMQINEVNVGLRRPWLVLIRMLSVLG